MSRPKAWMSWSTGKDSAWALHVARRQGIEIAALLTTLNSQFKRVAMHGVREELLDNQAGALGLPLVKVPLPWPCPNDAYEQAMSAALEQAKSDGITHMIFGDLFLEDIRKYREEKLRPTGIEPVFPIWGLETAQLAREMTAAGLRAYLASVDPKQIPAKFAGRIFDDRLLDELPPGADPCGENGEFHTFAFEGPMFSRAISVKPGEIVEREGFIYTDLTRNESATRVPGAHLPPGGMELPALQSAAVFVVDSSS